MAANQLHLKYLRSFKYTIANTTSFNYFFKLIHEFWGYCICGTNSLTSSLGFPASNGINMPSGFENGATVLLASGSDGYTTLGDEKFKTINNVFTSSYVGKHIVLWHSESMSSSTDDSIYRINNVIDEKTCVLDVYTGGTPQSGTNVLSFTDRSGINFRVVDLVAASNLSYTNSHYMILNFSGSMINSNQLNSQAMIKYNTAPKMSITLSSSGSWNGSTFAAANDTTEMLCGYFVGDNYNWYDTYTYNSFTIIGDQTSLMGINSSSNSNSKLYNNTPWFHIEIPKRVYSESIDPNPICCVINSARESWYPYNAFNLQYANSNFNAGWKMPHPIYASGQNWRLLIKNYSNSIYWNGINYPGFPGFSRQRFAEFVLNKRTNKFLISQGALGTIESGANLLRAVLRRIAFINHGNVIPRSVTFGDKDNMWYHLWQGVLIPWDGAVLPHDLTTYGP